jgi:nicotinamidase-related amidase
MRKPEIVESLTLAVMVFFVVAVTDVLGFQTEPASSTCAAAFKSNLVAVEVALSPRSEAESEIENCKARASRCEEDLSTLRAEMEKNRPKLPQPTALTLEPTTTALLVLDLTNRCNDPAQPCNRLAPRVKDFLPKARAAKVFTIFTLIFREKDVANGQVWDHFGRLPDEPVLAPDAFDKFVRGEIREMLEKRGIKTVIITGASSNAAVLYTATTAASAFKYKVVIPVDGIIAANRYIEEYILYQFTVLPNRVNESFSFTTLEGIEFK